MVLTARPQNGSLSKILSKRLASLTTGPGLNTYELADRLAQGRAQPEASNLTRRHAWGPTSTWIGRTAVRRAVGRVERRCFGSAGDDLDDLLESTLAALPLMLTVGEAAEVLRISRTSAYKLADEWRATKGSTGLPTVRFGCRILIRRVDLAAIVGLDPAG